MKKGIKLMEYPLEEILDRVEVIRNQRTEIYGILLSLIESIEKGETTDRGVIEQLVWDLRNFDELGQNSETFYDYSRLEDRLRLFLKASRPEIAVDIYDRNDRYPFNPRVDMRYRNLFDDNGKAAVLVRAPVGSPLFEYEKQWNSVKKYCKSNDIKIAIERTIRGTDEYAEMVIRVFLKEMMKRKCDRLIVAKSEVIGDKLINTESNLTIIHKTGVALVTAHNGRVFEKQK